MRVGVCCERQRSTNQRVAHTMACRAARKREDEDPEKKRQAARGGAGWCAVACSAQCCHQRHSACRRVLKKRRGDPRASARKSLCACGHNLFWRGITMNASTRPAHHERRETASPGARARKSRRYGAGEVSRICTASAEEILQQRVQRASACANAAPGRKELYEQADGSTRLSLQSPRGRRGEGRVIGI